MNVAQPPPLQVHVLCYLLPALQCYLVQLESTKFVRLAILPMALTSATWVLGWSMVYDERPNPPHLFMVWTLNFGCAFRYAISDRIKIVPPPRQVPLERIHATMGFRVVGLMLDEMRHVSVSGYSATYLESSPHSPGIAYLRATSFHLVMALLNLIALDMIGYPITALAPKTIGAPEFVTVNVHSFIKHYSRNHLAVEINLRIALFLTYGGVQIFLGGAIWHARALVAILIGFYIGEEWPIMGQKPSMADSVLDFWRRWHQAQRDMFLLWTPNLPSSLRIVWIFMLSAGVHAFLSTPLQSPADHRPTTWKYLLFFAGCGVVCSLERMFLKVTGRLVHGMYGRIWAWTVLLLLSWPMIEDDFGRGWAGGVRARVFADRRFSVVEWVAYLMDMGGDPRRAWRESS